MAKWADGDRERQVEKTTDRRTDCGKCAIVPTQRRKDSQDETSAVGTGARQQTTSGEQRARRGCFFDLDEVLSAGLKGKMR